MSEIILYGDPISTYLRTARLVCEEKGVAYEVEKVDRSAVGYRQLHPFGKMPAMRHGDFVLYETSAIARYIDEGFQGPSLQPAEPRERARMEQWISVVNAYVYDAMIRRFVLQFVIPRGTGGKPESGVIDTAVPEIRDQLALFDQGLGERNFLCGETPSLADFFLAPILYYVARMPGGQALMHAVPNVRRSLAVLAARPSFAATAPPTPA